MWDGYAGDGGDIGEIAGLMILITFSLENYFVRMRGVGDFYYTCDVFNDLRGLVEVRIGSVFNCFMFGD